MVILTLPPSFKAGGLDFKVSGAADVELGIAQFVATQTTKGELTPEAQKGLADKLKLYALNCRVYVSYPSLSRLD